MIWWYSVSNDEDNNERWWRKKRLDGGFDMRPNESDSARGLSEAADPPWAESSYRTFYWRLVLGRGCWWCFGCWWRYEITFQGWTSRNPLTVSIENDLLNSCYCHDWRDNWDNGIKDGCQKLWMRGRGEHILHTICPWNANHPITTIQNNASAYHQH